MLKMAHKKILISVPVVLLVYFCANSLLFALSRTTYFASTNKFYECNLSVYNFGIKAQRITDLKICIGANCLVKAASTCAGDCRGSANVWFSFDGFGNNVNTYNENVIEPNTTFAVNITQPLETDYNPAGEDVILDGYITVSDESSHNKKSEIGSVNLQLNCLRHGKTSANGGLNEDMGTLDKGMFAVDINGGLPL